MSARHVVVDGSNIATEGRSLPSLQQLDEAVQAFLAEHPHDVCTVVVDATFEHRIDASEKTMYDEALAANELLTPPAGSIGRGDKFILEIADRVGATVFSNDSFQEFHGEYEWLFDEGRLIGGKPVPGVGWVFVARTPVRGPKSRLATRAASRKKARSESGSAVKKAKHTGPTSSGVELGPMPSPKSPPPKAPPSRATRGRKTSEPTAPEPQPESTEAAPSSGRRRRRGGGGGGSTSSTAVASAEPMNAPLPFIEFVAEHQIGSEIEAEVVEFSSHGAYVMAGEMRCYAPLKFLGDPTPRSAREVLARGETRTFVVHAIHAARRGVDVALPEVAGAIVVAAPKTVTETPTGVDSGTDQAPGDPGAYLPESEATLAPTKKAATRKSTAKKAPAKKTTAARKATAAKKAVKKAPARKTTARKSPAKKTAAKKTAAKKTTARKTAAKKTTAKKTAAKKTTARKTAAKKTTAKKTAAKKTTARKTAAKKTTARKTAAKKTPARKTAARKSPARKTTARKAPARRR